MSERVKCNPESVESRMTTEQLVGVLQCANTTLKAVLHVFPEPDGIYEGGQLDEIITASQGVEPVWQIARNTARQAIEQQGLAEEGSFAKFVDAGGTRYAMTPAGQEIVRPVAAHLLAFSLHHGIGLNELIGQTVGRKRSEGVCENRLSVICAVTGISADQTSFMASDLHPLTDINKRTLHNHLRDMKGFGLLKTIQHEGRHNRLSLTPHGRTIFTEYLDLLAKVVTFDADFYYEGKQIAESMSNDHETARKLMLLAKARSNMASRRSTASTSASILDILGDTEGGLSTAIIAEQIGYKPTQTSRILGKLVAAGLVMGTQKGREKFWTPTLG